jgi:DNA-directed RNA polymerase specialized sigma24 family protein
MHELRAEDPADAIVAWEAVEDLLRVVPEGPGKDALRMVAAGLSLDEIADRLGVTTDEVQVLAARARIRVLTAAVDHGAAAGGDDASSGDDAAT